MIRRPAGPRRWLNLPAAAFWRLPLQVKLVLPTVALVSAVTALLGGYELRAAAAGVRAGELLNLAVLALTELAALLVGFRFWTRLVVTRRVRRLAGIAADVAAGALDTDVKESRQGWRGDEISDLAVSVGSIVHAARQRSERQAALDLLTEESARGVGLAQIYQRAVSVLADGAGGDFAAVYEMFEPSGMLILRAAVNDPGLKRQLALLGPRQYHSRVLAADDPIVGAGEESRGLGLPAAPPYRCAAVRIPGRLGPQGMLVMGSARDGEFAAAGLEFLRSLGHMVAAAVNALHDPLTGLPNRLLFEDRLGQAIDEGRRTGHGVCLYYIDLDNFKEVNDGLGHQAGDLLLRHVADRLRKVLRASDLLARLGGDEFALVQTISPLRSLEAAAAAVEPSEEAIAVQTATRLLSALSPPFTVEGAQLYVSASIGIAIHPEHGATPALLSRNADRAMYEAKAEQKGAFRIFTQSMHSAAVRRLTIESGLRAALQSGSLQLHFQPQVEVADPTAIVGFEALLRWPSSGPQQIAPSTFVPVAEQTGLIVPLGLWALRQACLQAVEWRRRGLPAARMAVNVAAAQFASPDFVASVRRVLDETGLDPSLLELEVTEGSVMRDFEQVTLRLNELRELGVTIAVDDFGTGYSSLAYLNRLPFDALKVDRSFVSGIHGRRGADDVLVGAIVQLGRSLNKIVIAEGIETVEQLHRLRGLGCDVGQGYLFARPIGADEASRLLGGSVDEELLRARA